LRPLLTRALLRRPTGALVPTPPAPYPPLFRPRAAPPGRRPTRWRRSRRQHIASPILRLESAARLPGVAQLLAVARLGAEPRLGGDRQSTRLNSSHGSSSYSVVSAKKTTDRAGP